MSLMLIFVFYRHQGYLGRWERNLLEFYVSQQRQQLQQIKGQLNQAQTDERIKQVVTSYTPQVGLKEIKTPQAFKDQYLSQISQSEQSIQN